MTPKEKAIELLDKYKSGFWLSELGAKQCALIAVNEIMEYLDVILLPNPFAQYWQEVKQEIEKL